MSKHLVRVGIQINWRSLSENGCTSQFVYRIYAQGRRCEAWPDSP